MKMGTVSTFALILMVHIFVLVMLDIDYTEKDFVKVSFVSMS